MYGNNKKRSKNIDNAKREIEPGTPRINCRMRTRLIKMKMVGKEPRAHYFPLVFFSVVVVLLKLRGAKYSFWLD